MAKKMLSNELPDIVQEFATALQKDLRMNSKLHIDTLTEIANENITYYKEISKAITTRINTAPANEKLYTLYLLDSIVKNIGGVYIEEFSKTISDVFFYAYKQIRKDQKLKTQYMKLLKTWTDFFGADKVSQIEQRVSNLEQQELQRKQQQQNKTSDQSEQELFLQLVETLKKHPDLIVNNPETARLFTELSTKLGYSSGLLPNTQPTNISNFTTPNVIQPTPSYVNFNPPNLTPSYTDWLPLQSGQVMSSNVQSFNPYSSSQPQQLITQTNNKQSKIDNSVARLYDAIPKQCMNCGTRFFTQKQLNEHLDTHQNKNHFFRVHKDLSRKWYVEESEWINLMQDDYSMAVECPGAIIFGDDDNKISNTDEEHDKLIIANTEQTDCPICYEPLDKFYDEDTGEWMLRGAVYDEKYHQFVHHFCSASIKKRSHSDDHHSPTKKIKQEN